MNNKRFNYYVVAYDSKSLVQAEAIVAGFETLNAAIVYREALTQDFGSRFDYKIMSLVE